jgi:hypothetical protein
MTIPVNAHAFNEATIKTVNEIGGVYCLLQYNPGTHFGILYVGLSENLRRRLLEHLNNPPIGGISHFHVEAIPGAMARSMREQYLIREFNPPGNVHHTR